jgi:hypothetical protein
MKLEPRNNQIIGRIVIRRAFSSIVRPDQTKDITKFILVDAVGSGAAAKGVKIGDVIVPMAIGKIMLDDGFRPSLEEENVGFFVRDVSPSDLLIQTDNGLEYVPFDSEKAAKSLGAVVKEAESEAA